MITRKGYVFYPEVLRAIRLLHRGRSAKSVAAAAGVPNGSYWGFENGLRPPQPKQAKEIARVLEVPEEAFYRPLDVLQEDAAGAGARRENREVAACN